MAITTKSQWVKDLLGNKTFAWSHVKTVFYNRAKNILLKDKLDQIDAAISKQNSDLAKWKFIQRYITISSGNDYWFSDDPFIDPSVHPEWRPVIVSELGMSTPDLFVTKAVFSEYGTLGVKFNRQVSGNHAMVLAILYLSD